MGELRSIILRGTKTNGLVAEELLVEKTMRIKKIELMCSISHTADCVGTAVVSKRQNIPLSKEHGHLAYLYVPGRLNNAADNPKKVSGVFIASEHIVIDYGADYVEIEEDNYLYIVVNATVGTATGIAIIYYEE